MKTHLSHHRRGFSLIEMLTVITILAILAAMVVAGTGFVKTKQAKSTAEVQIKLLSNALDQYQADHGTYPPGATGSKRDTNIIYRALYWDSDNNGSGADTDREQRIYLSELDPDNSKQGWISGKRGEVILLDPWGNEYFYRSGKTADGQVNQSAMNPDFDLWSAGPDGKTSESGDNSSTKDDIRNW